MSVPSSAPMSGTSRRRATLAVTAIAASLLAVAGVIAIALGAAFPLAIAVIEQHHLRVSSADLALAERLAGVAWAFIVAGVAALATAFVVPALVVGRPAGSR